MTSEEKNILMVSIEHHLRNKFQEAFDGYLFVTEKYPQNFTAANLLGILLTQNGHHSMGETYLAKASALIPENSDQKSRMPFVNSEAAKIEQERRAVEILSSIPRTDFDSVDDWRHFRMLDFVEPLVEVSDKWLTIGDSFGRDSQILKRKGVNTVVASNLDSRNLAIAQAAGTVDAFLEINAESIDLPDGSFDYVLCKDSLHHMPRPYLAIYEMLRISTKGVFFVDPQDSLVDWPVRKTDFHRELVPDDLLQEKVSFRKNESDEEIVSRFIDWYEDGALNYVYTFSKRELRKLALGMGLPFYGFKCFNDWYDPNAAGENITENGPGFRKTIEQIALHDKICEIVGVPYAYITGMLFKKTPAPAVAERLQQLGYELNFTPTRFLPIVWPDL
jgi:ubiquinone/menaquinone biosynthesis C-methylase UbiE